MFGTSSLSSTSFLILTVNFAASALAQPPQSQDWLKVSMLWQGLTSGTYTTKIFGESDASLGTATTPSLGASASLSALSTNSGRPT